ncbi:hypothetical protein Peur_053543 [Populus x canadensis]
MASAEIVRQTLIIEISRKRVKRLYLGNTSDTNHSVILPDDVIDKILGFLPIKKAMQIGILSSRFNHSWIFSRRLHFDNDFARGRSPENFKSMVNKVFDQHAGSSILSFRLSFDANGEGFLVEKWIKKAIEKGVEELELFFYVIGINFEGGGPVKLISDVYDVESIKILKLSFCQLDLPPKFKGFTGTFQVRNLVYDLYNIRVLTTTSTILEGLTPKFMGGTLTEMQFSFWNLIEFHLIMEGAMYCNPYDIASFLKNCQYVEKIFIDLINLLQLNDFNFVCGPYWELRNRQVHSKCGCQVLVRGMIWETTTCALQGWLSSASEKGCDFWFIQWIKWLGFGFVWLLVVYCVAGEGARLFGGWCGVGVL